MTANLCGLRRPVLAVATCLALSGAVPLAVQAGGSPVNDAFANARVINPASLPYSDSVNASGGTEEANEPGTECDSSTGSSTWWRFVPATNGTYRADTIGSGFNTLIDIFRGQTLTGLTPIECNDDIDSNNPDLLVSRTAFKATAGQTYYLRVNVIGSGVNVLLHVSKVTPPSNDSFANATKIKALPFETNASNINATSQPTEPRAGVGYYDATDCAHQRATRWYKYTPLVDQVLWANTFGATDFDTILGIYTGSSIGSATRVTCNNDQWLSGHITSSSGVTFKAKAGVTYRFQVGSYDGESGDYDELPFHLRALTATESNDDFANAATFNNLPYSDAFTLRRATRQNGEPTCRPGMANSVWYKYTPVITSDFHFSADEADAQGRVFVSLYQVNAPGFGGLQFLACGNAVGYPGVAGTTYMIQVETMNAYAPAGTIDVEFGQF